MKSILLSTFFAFGLVLQAVPALSENIAHFTPDTIPSCNLPAPSKIKIPSFGSTWANLVWTPVAGAASYRVKAIRLPGGIVDANVQTTSTSVTLTGLRPGGNYRFTVASICPNGIESDITNFENHTLIVLDIVLNAKPPKNCNYVSVGPDCHSEPWINAACWFKVSSATEAAYFEAKTSVGNGVSLGKVNNWCAGPLPTLPSLNGVLANQEGDEDPNTYLSYAQVMLGELSLCVLDVFFENTNFVICANMVEDGYTVEFLNEGPGLSPAADERAFDMANEPGFQLTVLENPTSDALRCLVKSSKKEPFRLTLLGFDGGIVFQQAFESEGSAQQIALNTSEIRPGIYVLQAQFEGGRKTFKVVLGR